MYIDARPDITFIFMCLLYSSYIHEHFFGGELHQINTNPRSTNDRNAASITQTTPNPIPPQMTFHVQSANQLPLSNTEEWKPTLSECISTSNHFVWGMNAF